MLKKYERLNGKEKGGLLFFIVPYKSQISKKWRYWSYKSTIWQQTLQKVAWQDMRGC